MHQKIQILAKDKKILIEPQHYWIRILFKKLKLMSKIAHCQLML